jgi:membrane fusion protein (multidrug efflux system)
METVVEEEAKTQTPPVSRPEPVPPQTPVRKAASPRAKIVRLAIVGLLILAGAGTAYWMHVRYRVSTDDAQVDGHIDYVSSRISGSLTEVLVESGNVVKAGQVLARIDPRDYQAKVDQARAALALAEGNSHAAQESVPLTRATTGSGVAQAQGQQANAEAELNRAQTSYTQASTSEIAVAKSNVVSAQATYDRAHADLERMRPLVQKAEISRQQFDAYVAAERVAQAQLKAEQDKLVAAEQAAQTSEQAVASAKARLEAARAAVSTARANEQQVNVISAQAESATAGIRQAQANLAAAELQLGYTVITSPSDGEVTRKTAEAGQYVQAGQALMMVVPLHLVWVTANFKETQLADVRPGQQAEVHVDMYGKTIVGRVHSIAGATGARTSLLPPENATGNFVKVVQRIPVKIVFDKLPEGIVLRPGMNVDATIITK